MRSVERASERIMREERGNHVREGEKKSAREREGARRKVCEWAFSRLVIFGEGGGAKRDFYLRCSLRSQQVNELCNSSSSSHQNQTKSKFCKWRLKTMSTIHSEDG